MASKLDFVNMSEEQYETLTHEQLYECYTEIVNVLGEYVMRMNAIDAKRNKVINVCVVLDKETNVFSTYVQVKGLFTSSYYIGD